MTDAPHEGLDPEPEPAPAGLPPGPLLGVDPGGKRVGVAAVGALGICSPVTQLDAEPEDELFTALGALAEARDSVGFVVGLPLNMDGSEGPSARKARAFGARLTAATGIPVDYQDERRTSLDAQRRLAPARMTRAQRKRRLDAVAAVVILEGYVERFPRL